MIGYPLRARGAVAILMRRFNDIDVYVEDSTYIGVYERLINRTISPHARVYRVIPLGPKDAVLAAAINDNDPDGRPRIYIVDGDLDIISTAVQRKVNRLHRLRVYSLENLLFEPSAIDSYCTFACPGQSVTDSLRVAHWREIAHGIEKYLARYFVALAIARRLKLHGSAFKFDQKSIFKKKAGHFVDVDCGRARCKTLAVIREIKRLKGKEAYRSAKLQVYKTICRKKLRGIDYFPGKTLLWNLNERIGHAGGLSLPQKAIASHLVDSCTFNSDPELARRLRKVSKARG